MDLFGRLEYFFLRLEKYIEVRPTAAMKNVIVKIMAEVLSILGVVTKEVGQGRTSMSIFVDKSSEIDRDAVAYLKKLVGRKDVEDALQRLDQLTQEEARMAAAEILTITRGIDDKVTVVGDTVKEVDENVKSLVERVQSVDIKVEGIDYKVQTVDTKVRGVDNKVNLAMEGTFISLASHKLEGHHDFIYV